MTILYINGDGHSSGAQATNDYCFAREDRRYTYRANSSHPDNLAACFGSILSGIIKTRLYNEAESMSSNARVMRATREWFQTSRSEEIIAVIGWTHWHREEWDHEGYFYQVTANGTDSVPIPLQERYRQWVRGIDSRDQDDQIKWHDLIWRLHEEMVEVGIKHLFFNSATAFDKIQDRRDWGNNYLDPYSVDKTYFNVLKSQGFQTRGNPPHYMEDAHFAWAQYLLPHLAKIL